MVLDRDVRAPEILSVSTAPRGYLLRRYASITSLVLIDVLSLVVAARTVGSVATLASGDDADLPPVLVVAAAASLVFIFALNHLYGLREARRLRRRRLRAGAWFVAPILIAGLTGLVPLGVAASVALLTIVLLTAGRELFDLGLRILFGLDPESRRTIIVGSHETYERYLNERSLLFRPERSRLLGIVDDTSMQAERPSRTRTVHLGRIADLEGIADLWRPDELVVVDPQVEASHLVDLADLCRRRRMTLKLMDLEMRFSTDGACLIPNLSGALFVAAPVKPSGLAWAIKRSFDVIVAATLLVVLSPLLLAVAVAVKLTSPGPVFYAAERVGLGQHCFRCYKFRTMDDGADGRQAELEALNEADGAIFKIREDSRVTRVGRWLRRTSIDELPQLINVLTGTMSITGPRPLPLRDNSLLKSWHKQRHVVTPGLTGLWQVSGRSDTSFDEMIRLDLQYVDNWSLWLDLSIAWRTVKVVLGGRGAC